MKNDTLRALSRAIPLAAAMLLALAPVPGWCDLTFDASYNGGGTAALNPTANVDLARDVAVQSDDMAVIAGMTQVGTSGSYKNYVFLARLKTNGSLDSAFGASGTVSWLPGNPQTFGGGDGRAVALDASGNIVVAGYYNPNDGTGNAILLGRFSKTNGAIDTTFGTNGTVIDTPAGGDLYSVEDVAIDAEGNILVAGSSRVLGISSTYPGFVARYTSAGVLDTTFGDNGVFRFTSATSGAVVTFHALLTSGTSVIAGGSDNGDAVLIKLTGAGALDASFGTSGVTEADGGGVDDGILGMAFDGSGNIVAAGESNSVSAVARFLADGTLDGVFESTAVGPFWAVVVLADGTAVAAGGGIYGMQVAADGSASYTLTFGSNPTPDTTVISGLGVDSLGRIFGAGEQRLTDTNYQALTLRMVATALAGGPDTTPDPFTFTAQSGVTLSTVVTSNAITVSGITAAATIAVSGDSTSLYSVNGGAFTASAGNVNNSDTVRVRHTSSSSYGTAVSTILTIGGVQGTFTSTTQDAPVPDTTPDTFTFTAISGADPLSEYLSESITVSGINTATPISITGGEYSIDGGAFTSSSGSVANAQMVQVRLPQSGNYGETANVVLDIGGVQGTFSVTARNANEDTTVDAQGHAVSVASTAGTTLTNLAETNAAPGTLPSGYTFPQGFFSFDVAVASPGDTATVTITLAAGATPSAYVKCNSGTCSLFSGASIAGNVVTLTLTDGGAGDSDGLANGTISDPGAPATTYTAPPVYNPPSGGGYGGALDARTLFVLLGLALLAPRRRRARA